MPAESLRSEFLCSVTGFVAPPRDIGETPRGTRRFYPAMRHGTPEVMARLAQGETVDPSEYYFRVAPMFETGAERYAWLNKILAVGVGERLPPNKVRYDIFEIL